MQLLNFLDNQLPDSSFGQLLPALEDIVSKIQIESNFCISHPDYQPLELEDEMVAKLQKLQMNIQNKYLNMQLRNFLHGIYFNGDLRSTLFTEANSVDDSPVHQNLENDSVYGLNQAFYSRLHESNCGKGYFDPGWCVRKQESDSLLVVHKNNLNLHVESEQIAERSPDLGDLVAVRMPHNLIENRFYVAVGNAGKVNNCLADGNPQTVDIYFNMSSDGAVAVMRAVTQQLNSISLPFTFKVLYDPTEYDRYDCGVLNLECSNYQVVRQVLENIYAQNLEHFQSAVPLFTKLLAPGLAIAEEPDGKFSPQESFGMNRCRIVANALLSAWLQGDNSKETRMNSIRQHFSQLGITLQRPYLNANSEDIYTPLDFANQ